VGDIQDLTMINEWNHVGTKDNPANLISRGCNPREIVEINYGGMVLSG